MRLFKLTLVCLLLLGMAAGRSLAGGLDDAGACTFLIVPSSVSVEAGGGSIDVSVVTQSTCAWSASASAGWITISGGSGTGSGTVTLAIGPNTGASRSGAVGIGGLSFSFTQPAGSSSACTYTVTGGISATATSGTVQVATQPGCGWSASSDSDWIKIVSGAAGAGSGTVSITLASNTGGARTGSITVAGQTFTVTQPGSSEGGCAYAVSGGGRVQMTSAGGTTTISVDTLPACTWSAAAGADWVTAAGGSGSGKGTVSVTVAANTSGKDRSTTLTIAGQVVTIDQSGGSSESGGNGQPSAPCLYAFPGAEDILQSILGPGNTTSLLVNAPPACPWTAYTGADWIEIPGSASGSGQGSLNLNVKPNNTGETRSATIMIAGIPFTITQPPSNACAYDVEQTSLQVAGSGFTGTVHVKANAGCPWAARPGVDWITIEGSASGTGEGSFTFTATANASGVERTGSVTVAGQIVSIQQPAATTSCAYAIVQASAGSIQVTAPAQCTWTASTSDSWITINAGNSGTGTDTVRYTLSANAGHEGRQGAITIAGNVLAIVQPGASSCFFVHNGVPLLTTLGLGGTVEVPVDAPSQCTWDATVTSDWIKVAGASARTGSGSVTLSLDPNISGTERTATVVIAGQTYTVKQDPLPGCTYLLKGSASATLSSTGGNASLELVAPAPCPWTASADASWVTLGSGTSGSGSAKIPFSVTANLSGVERRAAITVAGRKFTVTQAPSSAASLPGINENGVINAASPAPGALAPGSIVSIYGTALGPAEPVSAPVFPLGKSLGGVSVTIGKAGSTVNAYPLYVSATQINAIVPSNVPPGDTAISVTYNGATGPPVNVRVAPNALAVFAAGPGYGPGIVQNYVSDSEQVLNARSAPAKPGQYVTLWGTGLGAVPFPDNAAAQAGAPAVPLEVTVGGKLAKVQYSGRSPCCAGLDQIVIEVPLDAPSGCYVPVQIKVGGATFSNTITMAIDREGRQCSDPHNPFTAVVAPGRKTGLMLLSRTNLPGPVSVDEGMARFFEAGSQTFYPILNLPPAGTCAAYRDDSGSSDSSVLLGASTVWQQIAGAPGGHDLAAAPRITITGQAGDTRTLSASNDSAGSGGPYWSILGAGLPLPILGTPFLNGGAVRVSAAGGKDVGAFAATANLAAPLVWTNRDRVSAIDRSKPLQLTWSGAAADDFVLIRGTAAAGSSTAAFYCYVPAAPGSFTVPPSALQSLPAAGDANGTGTLAVGTLRGLTQFTAQGLDAGAVVSAVVSGSSVTYQ